ncbi:MAG: beta-ketoacyl-ACP synthase II [Acidobacteriota bacterium]|nr:beta-ketoacyl-ACP synthase II [Acidobacteriota bacterium]
MTRRRVAVTGVGLVSPLAVGTVESWSALLAGESGIAPIESMDASGFETKIAGEVSDFDPTKYLDKKEARRTDRFIQFGLAGAGIAIADADLPIEKIGRDRVGVIVGSGIGGLMTIEDTHTKLMERGPGRISPFFIPMLAVNMAAGHISIRYGLAGPNSAPATACTTGLHAIGDAYRQIQHGYADAMVTGGTEAVISPLAIGGFNAMKALSKRNDEPQKASRPWDRDRDGFVIGEGAGVLVLEEFESAKRRGADIYAEIAGYGMSADAHHISAPHPEGAGAEKVMRYALADAGLEPERVGYINAHGTSTPLGDVSEVKAIKGVFGDHAHKLAVSSTKSATGHLLGAAGGLESGFLALAIRDQILPATLNLDNPSDDCDLDFVPHEPRKTDLEVAITNSFGFGGTNGAIVMRRVDV